LHERGKGLFLGNRNFKEEIMKRLLLALVLALVGAALFAGTTGTLVLTGTVAASTNVTVTPQAGVFPMDLTTTHTNTLIAVVNEQTNDHLGYTVTVSSANMAGAGTQGFFKDAASGDTLNYSLAYNGTAVVFASGSAQVTNASAKTAPAGVDNNVTISYTGSTTISASNNYTDTLTFTIAGK
jgi:hypothetical protein